MDFHALTFAGLIRGSFHSEGNFESSPPHGEVDPKADRKRVTIVLLLLKWALFVLNFVDNKRGLGSGKQKDLGTKKQKL